MVTGYLTWNDFVPVTLSIFLCPLGEGGSPKGRGWIRLAEADSAKQRMWSMPYFKCHYLLSR